MLWCTQRREDRERSRLPRKVWYPDRGCRAAGRFAVSPAPPATSPPYRDISGKYHRASPLIAEDLRLTEIFVDPSTQNSPPSRDHPRKLLLNSSVCDARDRHDLWDMRDRQGAGEGHPPCAPGPERGRAGRAATRGEHGSPVGAA